ncbi:hypothetical protein R1sor_000935 [Riccia sorocarpa]|uniref:HTH CENPB-type domain-containing protein n=1 Tax=Riccia sorocarpa TaxID=122646 RepID=A0ABD3GVE8_9MARC
MAPRVQLTNVERAQICRFYSEGEGLTGNALSVWATKKFGVKERNVTLTDELVTDKAKKLYNTVTHDNEGGKEFKFSHGWLNGFKKRYGIKSFVRHGEAASVEITKEVVRKIEELKRLIFEFDPEDVYNMDETGLFFRLEPSRSLATKKMSGHKVVSVQSQVRVTRIEFFPPNVNAVYQPMDCGIIRAFKAHYRKYVVETKLEKISHFQDSQIDIYEDVCMLEKAWRQDVSSTTVRRCWRHSTLVDAGNIVPDLNDDDSVPDNGITELQSLLTRLQLESNHTDGYIIPTMDVNEYVDYETSVDVLHEDIEIDDLQQFLANPVIERGPESEITDSDETAPVISFAEATTGLSTFRTYLEQSVEDTAAILKQVKKFEKAMQAITINTLVQRDICSYFSSAAENSQI